MSKLFEQRLVFSDELEEALQQLADAACKSTGHVMGINTNRQIAPEGMSLHLRLAENMCVIELKGCKDIPRPTLTRLVEAAKEQEQSRLSKIEKEFPEYSTLPKRQKRQYIATKLREALQGRAMYVSEIAEYIPGAPPELIRKVAKTMRGVRMHRMIVTARDGKERWADVCELRDKQAPLPEGRKRRTRSDKGVRRNGQTTAARAAIVRAQMSPGSQLLERKVEDKPVLRSIQLSLIDGYWKELHAAFGNADVTGDQAAAVLGLGQPYTVEILRHMCYLGCADNKPKQDKSDPRKFFLIGEASDPTRDLAHRYSKEGKNGAAVSEPPPVVTKKPTVAAALRARRAGRE